MLIYYKITKKNLHSSTAFLISYIERRKLLLAPVSIVVMELQLGLALFPDINKFEMNKESTSDSEPRKDVYGSVHSVQAKKRNFNEAFDHDESFPSTTDEIPQTLALFSWDNDHTTKSDSEDIKPNHSLYVKVKMEGVAIARKVDLGQHHSYHSLATTLLQMFGKCKLNFLVF